MGCFAALRARGEVAIVGDAVSLVCLKDAFSLDRLIIEDANWLGACSLRHA